MTGDHLPDGDGPRFFGLYPAIVTDVVDDAGLGRVEVRFPWLGNDGDQRVRARATLLSPYADRDQGLQFVPEKGSQVVVAFEAGDPRRPYVVGACWNGVEAQPEAVARPNNKRLIKTRSKSVLEFDDTEGAPKVTLKTASGHTLELDAAGDNVTLRHKGGSVITMDAGGAVRITANSTVEVTASAMNVHAATATFDGVVNCTTLVAKAAVSSPLYQTGAGNIW